MKEHFEITQGTEEWNQIRCGRLTASVIPTLFMKESTKGYQDAIKRIAYERTAGRPVESYKSEWMARGNELEAAAIEEYQATEFCDVVRIGFVEVDEWCGCSPDGYVGDDGMIQVKCPKWNTFFDYRTIDDIDKDYIIQCQTEMLFSKRKWNDLYIYDPYLESKKFRILPDEAMQQDILARIKKAKGEVEALMREICAKGQVRKVTEAPAEPAKTKRKGRAA